MTPEQKEHFRWVFTGQIIQGSIAYQGGSDIKNAITAAEDIIAQL